MTKTLVHGEPNGPSLTALAALFETGQDASLEKIDLVAGARHTDPRFASAEVAMSVEGEGPVLILDGEPLADSVFIACYFDESAGGGIILPADEYERWQVMTWCRQIIERTAPAAAYLGAKAYLTPALASMQPSAFDALIAPIVSADLKERWVATRNNDFNAEKITDSEQKIAATVARIETQLAGKDWLFGKFGLADLETYAWIAGMRIVVPSAFENASQTLAWMDRVKARPSVHRALSFAAASDPLTSWAPGPEINRWG